jgi:hypothetical protein
MIEELNQQVKTTQEELQNQEDLYKDISQKILKLKNQITLLQNKVTYYELHKRITDDKISFDTSSAYRLTISYDGISSDTLGVYSNELEATEALLRHYSFKMGPGFKKNIDTIYSIDPQNVGASDEIHEVYRCYVHGSDERRVILGCYDVLQHAEKKIEQFRKRFGPLGRRLDIGINTIFLDNDSWIKI